MKYSTLSETAPEFYHDIGLMSGLEVHQQLLTKKKLFCRCPAGKFSKEWDAEILRHMRPTLSELGEYDGTALMEFKTQKNILYRINNETVCTYEFDDTPPFEINPDAVDASLLITLLLGCSVVSELHIARKQYLDGSIPAGFQRTLITGVGGSIPFEDRRIGIIQISLEEDSCREISDIGHERKYITDRLGMPLIETVTEPEMHTPQDVAAVCEIIRHLTRCTGRVRTGAGAARQDVNVSVRGGVRCEIKGVSSIKRIPLLVHNEAFRQVGLLEVREELKQRQITTETFAYNSADLSDTLNDNCTSTDIAAAKLAGKDISGIVLKGYAGILTSSLGETKVFADEISDRVRVIACLDNMPNLLYSDQKQSSLSSEEWQAVNEHLQAREDDAVLIVWGDQRDVDTALKEIVIRAKEAITEIPLETRQPMPDGTTRFERILPGADRMYPDTDLPPMPIADARIEKIISSLPTPPWEKEQRYLQLGISAEIAQRLSTSKYSTLFNSVLANNEQHAISLAHLFIRELIYFRRMGLNPENLNAEFMQEVLSLVNDGKIVFDAVAILIEQHLRGESGSASELVATLDLAVADLNFCQSVLTPLDDNIQKMESCDRNTQVQWAMGAAMKTLLGRTTGKSLKQMLDAKLDKVKV